VATVALGADGLGVDWQRLLAFNLDGTFLSRRAVAPVTKRQGAVVNISWIAARGFSRTSRSAYSAVEGGIIDRMPLSRVAEAADRAGVICFLASRPTSSRA
jgi:hypothetical protein